jgi:hypothetical protein
MSKLNDVARWMGPNEMNIVPMVNRYGQVEAAQRLGVTQPGLSKWLKDNGYVARIIWMKAPTEQEVADIEAAHDRVNAKRIAEGRPTLEDEERGS